MKFGEWIGKETGGKMFPPLVISMATLLLFSPCFRYGFQQGWDDNGYIFAMVSHFSPAWPGVKWFFSNTVEASYTPLTMLTYMLDYNLFQLNAEWYHFHNVLWHLAATLGVYCCFRELGINKWTSLVVCLVYTAHPQRIESVVWISERKDVVCAAFYFGSIWAYVRKKNGFPLLSLVLFIMALLGKPMAVSLPAVLWAYEIYVSKKLFSLQPLKRLWPFFLAVPVISAISIQKQVVEQEKVVDYARQAMVALTNYWWYVLKTFLPTELCPIYPRVSFTPAHYVLVPAAHLALAAWLLWLFIRKRRFFFIFFPLMMAYGAALLPVSGVFSLGSIDYADRYSYITSVFLLLGAAFLFQKYLIKYLRGEAAAFSGGFLRKHARKALFMVVLSVCMAYLVGYSQTYMKSWADTPSLFRMATLGEDINIYALCVCTLIEISDGNMDRAFELCDYLDDMRREYFRPNALWANKVFSNMLRGAIYCHMGEYDKSIRFFEQAEPYLTPEMFVAKPFYYRMLADMAYSYRKLERKEKALEKAQKLLSYFPEDEKNENYLMYRAILEYHKDDYLKSLEYFTKANTLAPGGERFHAQIMAMGKLIQEEKFRKTEKKSGFH